MLGLINWRQIIRPGHPNKQYNLASVSADGHAQEFLDKIK